MLGAALDSVAEDLVITPERFCRREVGRCRLVRTQDVRAPGLVSYIFFLDSFVSVRWYL